MPRTALILYLVLASSVLATPQSSSESNGWYKPGTNIKLPRVLKKVDPNYTSEARAERVQGTVIIQVLIDEKGLPTKVTILSPLGYGLDEEARSTVEKWRFSPAVLDGKPVIYRATVEVNFRLLRDNQMDDKSERQRTAFNVALQRVRDPRENPEVIKNAVSDMQKLAKQKYPPAMYAVGNWETKGINGPKNVEHGLDLIEQSAAKSYAPALYGLGLRRLSGDGLPKDTEQGLADLRRAAKLANPEAQYYLGDYYEKGTPADPEQAARYYRLCAAKKVSVCQYRVGRLLLNEPDRSEDDYIQALAFLKIAGSQGYIPAQELAAPELPKLTPNQVRRIESMAHDLLPR